MKHGDRIRKRNTSTGQVHKDGDLGWFVRDATEQPNCAFVQWDDEAPSEPVMIQLELIEPVPAHPANVPKEEPA